MLLLLAVPHALLLTSSSTHSTPRRLAHSASRGWSPSILRTRSILATVSGPPAPPPPPEDDDEGIPIEDRDDAEFLDELDASFEDIRLAANGIQPSARPGIRTRGAKRSRRRRRPSPRDADEDGAQRLRGARLLLDELEASYDSFTERPSQQFLLGTLALLLGFFVAQGQALGGGDQGGRWEYVSGGAATFVVERISRSHWSKDPRERSPTLRLVNAFSVGFVYGCILDALKFAG
jgi:hypothetical protein